MAILGSENPVQFFGNVTDADGNDGKKAPLRIGNTQLYFYKPSNVTVTSVANDKPVIQIPTPSSSGTYQFVGIPACSYNNIFYPYTLCTAKNASTTSIVMKTNNYVYTGFYSGTKAYSSGTGSFTVPLVVVEGSYYYDTISIMLSSTGSYKNMVGVSSYSRSGSTLTVNYFVFSGSGIEEGTLNYFIVTGYYDD